jgi:hypothetical protein
LFFFQEPTGGVQEINRQPTRSRLARTNSKSRVFGSAGRTWEVELGGRVEAQAAPGGQQRPDHLGARPGRRAGAGALGGRRRGRSPTERHVAQPPTPGLRSVVLLLLPVVVPLLSRQQQKQRFAAVYLGRQRAYGRGRLLVSEEGRRIYDWDGGGRSCRCRNVNSFAMMMRKMVEGGEAVGLCLSYILLMSE